jgi:hypothetical protein
LLFGLAACKTSGFSALQSVNPVMFGPVPSLAAAGTAPAPAPAAPSLGAFNSRSADSMAFVVGYASDDGSSGSSSTSSANEGDLDVLLATGGDPSQRVATSHIQCGGYDYNFFYLWFNSTSWCDTSGEMIPPPPTAAPIGVAPSTAPDVRPEVTAADPPEVVVTTEPPEPVYEEQTDPVGPGYVWTAGYWGWTGGDWAWYGGAWLRAPEGRLYVEPYYERVNGNVVYVAGYWGAPDAPRRSYGGDRIAFAAPVRPADYKRGEPARVPHSAGAAPGTRPATAYVHATGTPRPLPTRVESPRRTVAAGPQQRAPRYERPATRSHAAGRAAPAARSAPAPRGRK